MLIDDSRCWKSTPAVPVSDGVWDLSFGKFLQLMIYERGSTTAACDCVLAETIRYFAKGTTLLSFACESVDVRTDNRLSVIVTDSPCVVRQVMELRPPDILLKFDRATMARLHREEIEGIYADVNAVYKVGLTKLCLAMALESSAVEVR